MWIGKTGTTCRDLPVEYAKWSTVHKQFLRCAKGVSQMIFNTLAVDADTELLLLIDNTGIKA